MDFEYFEQFGAGYMRCPGKQLAHMQLSKLLPTLFLDYDISLSHSHERWQIARASLIARPFGWSVKMKRRRMIET